MPIFLSRFIIHMHYFHSLSILLIVERIVVTTHAESRRLHMHYLRLY
jgi:hypothetical protein